MAGIYFHIPFCKKACHYCDFHFSTSLKLKDELLASMHVELENNAAYLEGENIQTIYFGGGTPSILSSNEIQHFVEKVSELFPNVTNEEVTLEANPDDLNPEKLRSLRKAGINRLSIGVQSFRDEDLSLMNRAHNSKMASECIINARESGFDNISVDLIYGIPGMSFGDWQRNLDTLYSFEPEHISAYSLTIEDKTAFGHWVKKGSLKTADDENVIEQFQWLMLSATDHGYDQYEISNFSIPGREAKHNSAYWSGEKYLGIGPSAHSFNGISRHWNIKNNPLYIKAIKNNQPVFEEEILTKKDQFNEWIMTSLRTKSGIDLDFLASNFPPEMGVKLMEEAKPYLQNENLKKKGEKIILTEKGKLVADKITSDLFVI